MSVNNDVDSCCDHNLELHALAEFQLGVKRDSLSVGIYRYSKHLYICFNLHNYFVELNTTMLAKNISL